MIYIYPIRKYCHAEKLSCEIKTRTIHQPQKNGDIYVIERQIQYDPVKKYNIWFMYSWIYLKKQLLLLYCHSILIRYF